MCQLWNSFIVCVGFDFVRFHFLHKSRAQATTRARVHVNAPSLFLPLLPTVRGETQDETESESCRHDPSPHVGLFFWNSSGRVARARANISLLQGILVRFLAEDAVRRAFGELGLVFGFAPSPSARAPESVVLTECLVSRAVVLRSRVYFCCRPSDHFIRVVLAWVRWPTAAGWDSLSLFWREKRKRRRDIK